jgi:3-oxoacyl-[acyl-carrier protein] reductase
MAALAAALALTDQVALITGASRGIGAAIARAYAQAGATLVLTAQTPEPLEILAAELRTAHGTTVLVAAGEVSDAAAVQAIYQQVHQRFGRLDILVANAGILTDGMIGMIREQDIERVLAVNVAGVLRHTQAAARLMRRHKTGCIIMTSSIIGRQGNAGQMLYAASKAALLGAMRSAAKELGPDGIRVNALAPGMIETTMLAHLTEKLRTERMQHIALRRFGQAEEVADVALFLASSLARYVSGQVIGIDGGMVI